MNVFVAGASGVIGRRLVPLLVGAGHQVTCMTRKADRAEALRDMGAEAVICDAYDSEALNGAIAAAEPEVVVHQLTDIPQSLDFRRYDEQMAGNDRIRREVTPVLVEAAKAAGARRVVAQSFAPVYAPVGGWVKTEEDPLYDDAPYPLHRTVAAIRVLERTMTETPGIEGVVLPYGLFYGPGTPFEPDGPVANEVRRRRFPIVGKGTGVSSFIHVDDAAAATVLALDRGDPGIYNVTDDEPAPARQWLPVYALSIGAKPPLRVPALVARLLAGSHAVYLATELRGASNTKAERELDWSPRYASWREGFRQSS
jgi:2-alkyl-3-oxoalkanoate reductase